MTRILIPPDALHGACIRVTQPDILHHLRRVLRLRAGDPLECFDGAGRSAAGTVSQVTARELVLTVERQQEEPAPAREVILAHALIRPERFEWMLEKATELGVSRVLPLVTSRTTVRAAVGSQRLLRWRRIMEAACAQCHRNRVPALEPPQHFDALLERLRGACVLLPTLEGPRVPLADALRTAGGQAAIWLLIGPEGDFTSEEVAQAVGQGATAVHLGPRVLRSETAALAAVTLVQHLLQAP